MSIFVDTSVFLAVLNKDDLNNERASITLSNLVENGEILLCTNYILVEAYALIQNRMGMDAINDFQKDILPSMNVAWIDKEEHQNIATRFISNNRRQLSFVDCSSFEIMQRLGIHTAFTFDKHFREQGFDVIP